MKFRLFILAACIASLQLISCSGNQDSPAKHDSNIFIHDLINKMTLEEKIGQFKKYVVYKRLLLRKAVSGFRLFSGSMSSMAIVPLSQFLWR